MASRKAEAALWFRFMDYLQEESTDKWSEEVFKVFNLIKIHQPEKIIGKIIKGIPVITVIHSTKRGPALGGTRVLAYRNIANAMRDALKLASAMTYKAVWARTPLGGGKTVIFATPNEITTAFLKEYAKFLNEVNCSPPKVQFITGEDVGFTEKCADVVAKYTPYISGKSVKAGGLGDPSPKTAKGIFLAIKAIVEEGEIFSGTLYTKLVAIQGAGKVALPLIKMLTDEGARVYFSETNEKRAEKAEALGAQRVDVETIYKVPCHIFMPCAIGGVINKSTIPLLSPMCRIIIGAANNILDTPEDGIELCGKRIFYAPDYVVNRWGLEWVFQESQGVTDIETAEKNLTDIRSDILKLYQGFYSHQIPSCELADRISRQVLDQGSTIEEAFEVIYRK